MRSELKYILIGVMGFVTGICIFRLIFRNSFEESAFNIFFYGCWLLLLVLSFVLKGRPL
jgi:hypothetical protein